MSKPYVMHPASPDDLPDVTALLDARRRWLQERGIDQWNVGREFETRMAGAIDRHEAWLLRDDGAPIATLTMTPEGDPDFWTSDELQEFALYLGKMATAMGRSGEGLGALMLSWARDRAARSGFNVLRWDVWKTNKKLLHYYCSVGARYIRTVEVPGRWSGALFEISAQLVSDLTECVITQ